MIVFDRPDLRFAAFLCALFLYALCGVPTPDNPGPVEALIGLLLVVAVGFGRGVQVLNLASLRGWERAGAALLLYGLSIPCIVALLSGNAFSLVLRDLIPFIFLLLPLFLYPLTAAKEKYAPLLTAGVAGVGIAFAARLLWSIFGGGRVGPGLDPFYLANAPTVMFAALICLGLAGSALYHAVTLPSLVRAGALAAFSLPPLIAMALVMQRATMGLVAGCLALWLVLAFVRNPGRAIFPFLVLVAAALAGHEILGSVYQSLLQKTAQVGFNMRGQELLAVLGSISRSIPVAVFGRGWGATFESPAVGGVAVNFTHSLLTGVLLKTGLCGLSLALLWLGTLANLAARLVWQKPVLALALTGPLVIDVFLYASYKSLDFGLVLLLVPLWALRRGREDSQ